MIVFDNYARYYDLLYQNKDYKAETQFVYDLLKQHLPSCHSVLELGSGTGGHAEHLAALGLQIDGVDFSEQMLDQARARLKRLPASLTEKLTFHHGDVRNFRLPQKFDAVISLFHVMSYQTTNDDVAAAFATAKEHLKPGGIFLFDCWYGPGVLTDRPTERHKKLEDEVLLVNRAAHPAMHPNENVVDVNYTIAIKNKIDGKNQEFEETHRMRYFFQPEIELFCAGASLEFLEAREWLGQGPPGFQSWSACFVLRRDVEK